jgi:phosphoglycolate phosphatase
MKNDAIIFDIDGTLWDACPTSAKGWNKGLDKFGIKNKITSSQVRSVAGRPQEECMEILLPGLKETYLNLFEVLDECEKEAIESDGGIFYDGAVEGIKELAKSYKIFVVSNCTEWYLYSFFEFSGLKPILSGFNCNGLSNLPKWEMLIKIKNDFSLKNPVYVGDTASDEESARLSGMDFIHVSHGFGKPKGKTKTFDSFKKLVGYFIDGSC